MSGERSGDLVEKGLEISGGRLWRVVGEGLEICRWEGSGVFEGKGRKFAGEGLRICGDGLEICGGGSGDL